MKDRFRFSLWRTRGFNGAVPGNTAMSRKSVFRLWRTRLDEAITYGTKKEALSLARQALAEARTSGNAAETEYFKGQVDLIRARPASAIGHFDAAIRLNPKDGASFNDRALCMVEIGYIDDAIAYFDRGIAAEPDYATIYHNKGWLLNNIGCHTEAIRCFRKALALEPGRAVTYDNLADALYNLGDLAGALEAYKKVLLNLAPGRCLSIRKQICRQIKDLEKKLRTAP